MSYPLTSIIVPNYNKGEFIEETILSVINQTVNNWELIIIDDGSTDNSFSIMEKYSSTDNRIKVKINNSGKKGGSVCRNIGLACSCGNFVVFFDSDDVMGKQFLERRYDFVLKNSGNDFYVFPVGTFIEKIGDNNQVWNNFQPDLLNRFLSHDLPWNIMSVMWKGNYVRGLGGFDESLVRLQDVELHTRALMDETVTYQVANNYDPDCFYRISVSRLETNRYEFYQRKITGLFQYLEKMGELLDQKGQRDKFKLLATSHFTLLTQLWGNRKEFEESEFTDLLYQISKFENCPLVFSKRRVKVLRFYNNLRNKGVFWRGMNYLFRKVIN